MKLKKETRHKDYGDKKPRVMRELQEIHAWYYEDNKRMIREYFAEWINEKALKVIKEYGMELTREIGFIRFRLKLSWIFQPEA